MLTEPSNGRCTFSILNFERQMSCVADIPVDWLLTCKFGLEHKVPVSLIVADHGNEYIVLLLQQNDAVLIKDIENQKTFECLETNLSDFTERLIEDIRKYFTGWVKWYPAKILGSPDKGREKTLEPLLGDTEKMLTAYKETQNKECE